jgi:hypothetical protein
MMSSFLIVFLLFNSVWSIFLPGRLKEPNTHRAARLILDGIRESETGSGAHFGTTKGAANDVYVSLNGGQVKSYRPVVFKHMRSSAGVSESSWLSCMNPDELENICADSKSGQAFWKSKDGVLVLKTIKGYECRNLREVVDNLANHLDVPADHSCISSVLGLFRVKFKNGRKIYLMASRNVYPTTQLYNTLKFDLKGSTVGRKKSASSSVLKDLDLLRSHTRFQFGDKKDLVLRTLQRDVNFLSRCGFMDYSLLVNVEYVPASFLRKLKARLFNPTTGAFREK